MFFGGQICKWKSATEKRWKENLKSPPKSQVRERSGAPQKGAANPSQSNLNSKHHLLSNKTHPSILSNFIQTKKSIFETPEVFFFGHFWGKNWKNLQLILNSPPFRGLSSIRPKASHPSGLGLVEILLLRPLGTHISDASLQPCHLGLATWKEGAGEGVCYDRKSYAKCTKKTLKCIHKLCRDLYAYIHGLCICILWYNIIRKICMYMYIAYIYIMLDFLLLKKRKKLTEVKD